MTKVHELSCRDARRIAVQAQALTMERPADLLELLRRLSLLQLDPTKAIAPSADLVAWSRLRSAYSSTELEDAIAEQSLIGLRPNDGWGYYALLYGDHLVGMLDATADREAGVLHVNALHWDVDRSKAVVAAGDCEIDQLAAWLNLEPVRKS